MIIIKIIFESKIVYSPLFLTSVLILTQYDLKEKDVLKIDGAIVPEIFLVVINVIYLTNVCRVVALFYTKI
ncbi:hypothetical protein FC40_GL000727 [Ligilactobacillus hayakitensis DSM 18933 = JCM 14209]|uniref:Uncharacterized protein n=1 Tax=Ligilactobacillus hayakitensis DSM 18933 = JCM 14209 TaxID=1423755 RepID=A0A0R1WLU5_9LACO|nr:hypothetical protein FC40_GL000727 [Ligilactobacillus hayakitensis DSM 18933 = JCM 14209]